MYIPLPAKKEIRRQSQSPLELVIILDNVQYARNVAEIFQLAEGFRVKKIILTGSSAKPPFGKDLQKATLTSEKRMKWESQPNASVVLEKLKQLGYQSFALSFNENATNIYDFKPKSIKIAIVIGNETNGLSKDILQQVTGQYFVPTFHANSYLTLNLSTAITLNTLFINAKK